MMAMPNLACYQCITANNNNIAPCIGPPACVADTFTPAIMGGGMPGIIDTICTGLCTETCSANDNMVIAEKQALMGGGCDAYALVIFESSAARTLPRHRDRSPQWGASEPRAFRFPIHERDAVLQHRHVEKHATSPSLGGVACACTSCEPQILVMHRPSSVLFHASPIASKLLAASAMGHELRVHDA